MIKLAIEGMTCQHCVSAVKNALAAIEGVTSADVSLDPGQAIVEGQAEPQTLIDAVTEEGYNAQIA